MVQAGKKCGVLALGVVVAGAATLVAQQRPNFSTMDNTQAREITQLIEQGQISLHEAIRLVETKANGKALECFTMLEFGAMDVGHKGAMGNTATGGQGGGADTPPKAGATGGPRQPNQPVTADKNPPAAGKPGDTMAGKTGADNAQRVVYHVRVFANGSLIPYMVDAKTREVTEIGDRFKQTSDRPILDRNKDLDPKKDKDVDKD